MAGGLRVDRLVVVRNGILVTSQRYENDYRAISRGSTDPLGCGFESREGSHVPLEYNYYHSTNGG